MNISLAKRKIYARISHDRDIIIVIDKDRRNYRILYRDNTLIEKIIEPLRVRNVFGKFKDFIKVEESVSPAWLSPAAAEEGEMKVIPYNIIRRSTAARCPGSSGARWITLEDHLDQDGRKAAAC